MATNDILPFCATDTGTNLLTEADYTASSDRTSGNKPGIASSKLMNKAIRQCAFIASQFAQYISNKTGNDVLDDANNATLLATVTAAFQQLTVKAKTANYTVLSSDQFMTGDATGGAFSFSLPAAASNAGKAYYFKRIDNVVANAITIARAGSDTIDGATSYSLVAQYQSVLLICDGTSWNVF